MSSFSYFTKNDIKNIEIDEDLNKKIEEIKRTVSELKLQNYDSNSTNDFNYGNKTHIFSEEELNKEVAKVNEKVFS